MVGAALALIYLVCAPIALPVVGRWPAPYWLAIGLTGFTLSCLICTKWSRVLAGMAIGAVASVLIWYAEIGAYHVVGQKWAYSWPWYFLLKVPVYLLLASIFFLDQSEGRFSPGKAGLACGIYFLLYFFFMSAAPFVCNIALRPAGTFPHGNYDDFGYRLGAFALAASFVAALLARPFRLPAGRPEADERHNLVKPVDPTSASPRPGDSGA